MGTSSHRVGPSYDTLRIVIQPHSDRTTYSVVRLHFDGPNRTDIRIASGGLALSPALLARITAPVLMRLIADSIDNPAQPSAPPPGDMGEQSTLDLASRP